MPNALQKQLSSGREQASVDDHARFPTRLIIGIHGIGEKYAVEHVERFEIAGADAEKNERFLLFAHIDDLDRFALRLKFHHGLALRKKQILGRFYRFKRFDRAFRAFRPKAVVDFARLFQGHIQGHGGGELPI